MMQEESRAREEIQVRVDRDEKQSARQKLAWALRHPRYEVIPLDPLENKVEQISRYVPSNIPITVTASPQKGIEHTIELAEQLSAAGYETSPHLSARLISGEEHLKGILGRLDAADIDDAFVIAGDAEEPAGEFEGALPLLQAMSEIDHHLEDTGITGYPESHPLISDEATIQAMHDKAPYATYIVSQVCFEKDVIVDWARKVRKRGIDLPLYIGMPGAVSNQKLMRISMSLGLGESARFLKKHSNWLLRMFVSSGYRPNRLIESLTPELANSESGINGFHIYTFNDIQKTENWRRETLKNLPNGK